MIRQRRGVVVGRNEEESAQEFDDRISRSDRRAAVATASTEEDPAYDGNVVVGANGSAAVRTGRTRLHHGNLARHAINNYVEKAAKDQSEKKSENGEKAAGKNVGHARLGLARL